MSGQPKVKVILFGNPGVGKSTLLNTLTKSSQFPSGISLGGGLTRDAHHVQKGRYIFIDTPGLDDEELRPNAAQALSKVLSAGGLYKLVFVTTLESGVVRPADVVTMKLVLDAVHANRISVDGLYAVWFNKCLPVECDAINDPTRASTIVQHFAWKSRVPEQIVAIPREPTAEGENNARLSVHDKLLKSLSDVPTISIPVNSHVDIDENDFMQKIEDYKAKLYAVSHPAAPQPQERPLFFQYVYATLGCLAALFALQKAPKYLPRLLAWISTRAERPTSTPREDLNVRLYEMGQF